MPFDRAYDRVSTSGLQAAVVGGVAVGLLLAAVARLSLVEGLVAGGVAGTVGGLVRLLLARGEPVRD